MNNHKQPLFALGETVATPKVLDAVLQNRQTLEQFLARHQMGDWGIVNEEEWIENNEAIEQGERILSAYRLTNGTEFWVITEGNRSVTTALLPFES